MSDRIVKSFSLSDYISFHYIKIIMSNTLQQLKSELNLDGILVTDSKGFEIYNNGFTHTHHLHALKQLSRFFFPGQEGTVVGIETDQFTVVVKDTPDGNLVAMKEIK